MKRNILQYSFDQFPWVNKQSICEGNRIPHISVGARHVKYCT